jgi:hypothetical protein
MKAKLFLLLFACAALMACEKNSSKEESFAWPAREIVVPRATMVVVKFAEPTQQNNVIVGDRVLSYDTNCGSYDGSCFEYDEEGNLYLLSGVDFNSPYDPNNHNQSLMEDTLLAKTVTFWEDKIHLRNVQPYIPITDGYVLVDWRWADILPISTFRSWIWRPTDKLNRIQNHCFLTNLSWGELEDVRQGWQRNEPLQPLNIEEMWYISYYDVDKYCGRNPDLNNGLYGWGLTLSLALYYNEYYPEYLTPYMSYCQKEQEQYRQLLVNIIKDNALQKIGL